MTLYSGTWSSFWENKSFQTEIKPMIYRTQGKNSNHHITMVTSVCVCVCSIIGCDCLKLSNYLCRDYLKLSNYQWHGCFRLSNRLWYGCLKLWNYLWCDCFRLSNYLWCDCFRLSNRLWCCCLKLSNYLWCDCFNYQITCGVTVLDCGGCKAFPVRHPTNRWLLSITALI